MRDVGQAFANPLDLTGGACHIAAHVAGDAQGQRGAGPTNNRRQSATARGRFARLGRIIGGLRRNTRS